MSYVAKDKDVDAGAPAPQNHKIRITLTSKNVKNLEKGEFQSFLKALSFGDTCANLTLHLMQSAPTWSLDPRTSSSESRDPFVCPPRSSPTRRESRPVVRVPRPGTDTSSESTSV